MTLLLVVAIGVLTSCARPPYAGSTPPSNNELLARAEPQFSALTVPQATLRPNRQRKVDLMFVAQSPGRFRATVQLAGNELVSIAVNEAGYTLRNLLDSQLGLGFYAGPPAACALEMLAGLRMPPEDFVRILLGGAPPLAGTSQVTDRRFRRRRPGAEVITLESASHVQTLHMRWLANDWWVAGITRDRKSGRKLVREWSVEHEGLHPVAGGVLPRRTVFSVAASDTKITLDFREQLPNPEIDGGATTPTDSWDEGDDEGWEDLDGEPAAGPGKVTHPPASKAPSSTPAASTIPPIFFLDGAGLTPRGDLCARTRSPAP